jgi:hypothetical protein
MGLIPGRAIGISFAVMSGMTSKVFLITAGKRERTKQQRKYQTREEITKFDWHIR